MNKFDRGFIKKLNQFLSLKDIISSLEQGRISKNDIYCPDCQQARLKLVHKKHTFLQTSNKQIHGANCSKTTKDITTTSVKEKIDSSLNEVKLYINNTLISLLNKFELTQINSNDVNSESSNLKDEYYFQNKKEIMHKNRKTKDISRFNFTNYKNKIIPTKSKDTIYFGVCKIEKRIIEENNLPNKYLLIIKHHKSGMSLATLSITAQVYNYLGSDFKNHINNDELYKVSFFTNGQTNNNKYIVILNSQFLVFTAYAAK